VSNLWFETLDDSQDKAARAFHRASVLVLTGAAGSGKTHVAVGLALAAVALKRFDRLVVSRPTVEVGRSLGYLKGTLDEKFAPWLGPIRDVLARMSLAKFDDLPIDVVPMQHVQGRSFHRAVLLLDEAQNATAAELTAVMTRLGDGGKVVFAGDTDQALIPDSGLAAFAERLKGLAGFEAVRLRGQHRNPFIRAALRRLEETKP